MGRGGGEMSMADRARARNRQANRRAEGWIDGGCIWGHAAYGGIHCVLRDDTTQGDRHGAVDNVRCDALRRGGQTLHGGRVRRGAVYEVGGTQLRGAYQAWFARRLSAWWRPALLEFSAFE